MSNSDEPPAAKQARLDSGKTKKERRRSSFTRGRRSSIGIPGLRPNEENKTKDSQKPEDLKKLLNNCFETALKHCTKYLNSEGDKSYISHVRQIFQDVLTDVVNDTELKKTETSEQCPPIQELVSVEEDINRSETYNKKLEKQCKDWDHIKNEFTKEEFLRSDIKSELTFDHAKSKDAPNCKQLLQNLNKMKEKLLIKVDSLSAEVNSQVKSTFDIQNAIKPSKLHRNNFSAAKLSSPNIKQLIREMPLDDSFH